MLEAKNINKKFGGVIALDNATLNLERGEIRALVGGNGSGKSTLSKILAGSYKPDSGEIYIDGELMSISSPKDAQKIGIATTYQELSLLPNLTVAENLVIGNLPRRFGLLTDQKALHAKALAALELIDLGDYANQMVQDIPLDDKYMVELVKAVIQEPKYLIIDEVASALRREQVQQIAELVEKLSKNNCAILYITHRLHEVYSICKTVSVMRSGKVLVTSSLSDITPDEIVDMMMSPEEKSEAEIITQKAYFSPIPYQKEVPRSVPSENRPLLEIQGLLLPGAKEPINIKLKQGEIIGIAGLQGQGQSILLRSIFGVYPGITAKIVIEGKQVVIDSPKTAIKNGIGFLSGDREKEGVFPIRSVKENLEAIPNKFILYNPGEGEITLEGIIKRLGIVFSNLQQTIRSLSGGNQQKVIIGRWLSINPKILLCDDPTKGVDVNARQEVHSIFKDMAAQKFGLIISSSDDAELIHVADRILVMYGGSIVKELTGSEMTEQNIVAASIPFKSERRL